MEINKKTLIWNDAAYDYFETHIHSHHGEVFKAIFLIEEYLYALKNGDQIHYLRAHKKLIIKNFKEFKILLLEELSMDANHLLRTIEAHTHKDAILEEISEGVKLNMIKKGLIQ